MSSEQFKPEKKGPGRPPKGNDEKESKVKAKSPSDLARERYNKRKEQSKKPGAFKGQRLWAPEIKGLELRWVVDEGGRLDLMETQGYYKAEKDMHPEFVGVLSTDPGVYLSQVVSHKGEQTRQYLMMRPLDISEEVLQEKRERLRKRDQGVVGLTDRQGIGQERTSSGRSAIYDPTKGNSVFEV